MRASFLLVVLAACGGKVEHALQEDGDPRAGFVKCGGRDAGSCDVGGNECFSCNNGIEWRCQSLDLVPSCSRDVMVRRECDGNEDCRAGSICVLDAYSSTLCR